MFGLPCYPAVCPGYARPTACTPCAGAYAAPVAAAAAAPVAAAAKTSGCGCGGWNGIIALFILVGLLALFIPGGFFFILLLILLLILICACGVCR